MLNLLSWASVVWACAFCFDPSRVVLSTIVTIIRLQIRRRQVGQAVADLKVNQVSVRALCGAGETVAVFAVAKMGLSDSCSVDAMPPRAPLLEQAASMSQGV